MGHGPRTITDLYRRHEVLREHLERDRATLQAFIPGGISGGTDSAVSPDAPVTRPGIEPGTYGLKAAAILTHTDAYRRVQAQPRAIARGRCVTRVPRRRSRGYRKATPISHHDATRRRSTP